MVVISDTSPITNLIQLKRLDLLHLLFGEVIIPERVYEELAVYENQEQVLKNTHWLIVKSVADSPARVALLEDLDPGEVDAIILAKTLRADYLIIDERKGRKAAEAAGIQITGLIGILIKAKQNGHLTTLKPLLDELITGIGFHINRKLYERALRLVGEA